MARVAVCLLALLVIFGIPAHAQEYSKVDVFAGYSLFRATPATSGFNSFTLNGGSASGAFNINNWLGGVADFGGYHNGNILNTGASGTLYTYLFGPRVSYRKYDRFTPFGQVLFGGAHASSTTFAAGSEHAFAWALGGGLDARVNNRFSVRLGQLEYLMTRFGELGSGSKTQNNFRFSAGVLIHF